MVLAPGCTLESPGELLGPTNAVFQPDKLNQNLGEGGSNL